MAALVLNGKELATRCEEDFRRRVNRLHEHYGRPPLLATVLVGEDPASATYVRMKGRACQRVGMKSRPLELSAQTSTAELLTTLEQLNQDPEVDGILLQHPVPAQIDERRCFDAIAIAKDVDGVSCLGYGRTAMGVPAHGAATPAGVMRLLAHYQINLEGMDAVVVGRSPILGKPMAAMLLNANATVTICHSRSRNLRQRIQQAELVVGALGQPEFIRGDWVRDGAVVVDAGYHPGGVGDVELQALKDRVRAYTPVPGGVGPMTINTLILQCLEALEQRAATG